MGVSKAVVIGGRVFPRQRDALDFFKEMLGRYQPGQRVTPVDEADLRSLLQRHEDYYEKVGVGIEFLIVMDDGYGWKCFGVSRVDGTIADFSYIRCVTQRW